MNDAIMEVRLGHFLKFREIMVDKDGSVFLLRGEKKSLCGVEKDPPK